MRRGIKQPQDPDGDVICSQLQVGLDVDPLVVEPEVLVSFDGSAKDGSLVDVQLILGVGRDLDDDGQRGRRLDVQCLTKVHEAACRPLGAVGPVGMPCHIQLVSRSAESIMLGEGTSRRYILCPWLLCRVIGVVEAAQS